MVDHGVEASSVEEVEVVVGKEAGERENCVFAFGWRGETCHLLGRVQSVLGFKRDDEAHDSRRWDKWLKFARKRPLSSC